MVWFCRMTDLQQQWSSVRPWAEDQDHRHVIVSQRGRGRPEAGPEGDTQRNTVVQRPTGQHGQKMASQIISAMGTWIGGAGRPPAPVNGDLRAGGDRGTQAA